MRTLGLLGTLLLALVAAPLGAEEPVPAGGSPAAPAQLRSALQEALEVGDEEGVVEALAATAGSSDEGLARDVRKALAGAQSRAVRHGAVAALGRLKSAAALDALHDYLRRESRLKDDEELFALTLKEVGRHGSKRSLDLLLDNPFRWLTVASGTARLMAVANIRAPEAVEGLIAAGKKVGTTGARGVGNEIIAGMRPAFRAAMVVLTGHDAGPGAGLAWERWWKDTGRKAGIAPQRPAVPAQVRVFWEAFWKEPYGVEAPSASEAGPMPVAVVKQPTPEQVDEAVQGLAAAFKGKDDPEVIAEALQRFGGVHDKRVVHEVARGLTSPNTRVRWITIDVLGWSTYPPALKQLHRLVSRERDLSSKDEALFAHLLKAIGRHGDKSSIEVLADNPLKNLTYASGRARILGLARIRSKESIEEVLSAMKLSGERPRRRGGDSTVPRFLQDYRLALAVLTGEDKGPSKTAWIDWWRDEEKRFKMSPVRPTLAPPLRVVWEEYWDEPYLAGR